MRNSWYKKGLVLSIIILFYGVGLQSSVSSRSLSISNEEMLENNTGVDINDEIVLSVPPDGTEIFTRIWVATANFGELNYEETGEGFFRHVEIWIDSGSISFYGFMCEFPWRFSREVYDIRHLILPRCHITQVDRWPFEIYVLSAFAIGDIYK
jgi:hypothetical protein